MRRFELEFRIRLLGVAALLLCMGCAASPGPAPALWDNGGAPSSEAVPPSPPNTLMPIPAHDTVLKRFPRAAAVLPRAQYATLTGNGLDKDLLIRQTTGGEVQWVYVVNPGFWAEHVKLTLEEPTNRTVFDPFLQSPVELRQGKEGAEIDVALGPWAIKVLKIQPPTAILSAAVRPDASILKTIEAALRDVDMMLPYLATRRPNLIRNGDFEEVDAKGVLVGWKLYAWHAADREVTVEAKDASAPARFLRINNLKGSGTVGIYSSRFSLAPGQEYTFLARLAGDRAGVKARVALVGQRHIAQTYTVDTTWREVSYVWPREQSAALGQGAKLRAEIHNDGAGALLVDNVRVVDSTFLNYPESVATEQAIADVLNARRDENLCRAFTALSNARITRLLDTLRRRRAGNEWLLIGPFDSAKGGLAGAYPPEADYLNGADLSVITYAGKENRTFKGIYDWTIKNMGAPDYIDLVSSIGPFDYSEAFALSNFYSEANQKANLLIGADDGMKVWLNGVAVLTKTGERAAKAGEFVVPVALRRGWNRVLVKVENIEKDWGFYFTVADESAKRIPGVRYAVKRPSP